MKKMKKAVIDMGTNSTRLAVAERKDNGFDMIYTEVRNTRLGEGVGSEQIIKEVPLKRNIDAVKDFIAKAGEMGVNALRMTATSAVREAVNKEYVQEKLLKASGIPLEILPGEEEARLSYMGASKDFRFLERPLMVLDIGGGSTELVYQGQNGIQGASVSVGAVRLLEHPEMRAQLSSRLEELVTKDIPKDAVLIAVGGTNTCLMAMELGLTTYDKDRIHGQKITDMRVNEWAEKLLSLSQEEREQIPGMKSKRADIMPYGVMILREMMKLLKVSEAYVSDKGLVYGLMEEVFANEIE